MNHKKHTIMAIVFLILCLGTCITLMIWPDYYGRAGYLWIVKPIAWIIFGLIMTGLAMTGLAYLWYYDAEEVFKQKELTLIRHKLELLDRMLTEEKKGKK
jgi:hypothetical protein